MATILVVEDDANMRLLTCSKLKKRFSVLEASNGIQALEILDNKHVDLIVADIMMPGMDGYTLVRTLREEDNPIPILMLTAKNDFEDKKEGFASGTDDYMTKPINFEELFWRIDALLRRARISSENKITIGDIVADADTYSIRRIGKEIVLSKKEFELLYQLLSYPKQVFTKDRLLDNIWGYDSNSGEDTVKTYISRLRNKLKDFPEFQIVTLRGVGYKMEIEGKFYENEQ